MTLSVELVKALGTLLSTSVVAAAVTAWVTGRRAERERRRQKAEDLYSVISSYGRAATAYYVTFTEATSGTIDIKQAFDINAKRESDISDAGDSLDRAMLIVSVYFPRLMEHMDDLISARNALTLVVLRVTNASRSTGDSRDVDTRLGEAIMDHARLEQKMRDAIIVEATRLNRRWWNPRPPRIVSPVHD